MEMHAPSDGLLVLSSPRKVNATTRVLRKLKSVFVDNEEIRVKPVSLPT